MAHELTFNRLTRKVEMAYLQGVDRWHGLGNVLKPGASIEDWQEAAGMQWSIRRSKLMYFADRAGTDARVDSDYVALVRSDTGDRLGIVSADYQIVQPFEVLEFFRDLVKEDGFTLTTAGTLFGGKRFWALAKMDSAKIAGWDEVGGYYLLSTSADGSRSTEGRETTICVVCNNTLSAALANEDKGQHGFKHSHRNRFDYKKIHERLGLAHEHFHDFIESANTLSKKKVSDAAAEEFINTLLRPSKAAQAMIAEMAPEDTLEALLQKPFNPAEAEEQEVRRPRGADTILDLFLGGGQGATERGRSGTAWGLVNAVTEYVDHYSTAKTVDHRIDRAYWGDGDKLKTEAMTQALAQFA